jgi:hypothetical protein
LFVSERGKLSGQWSKFLQGTLNISHATVTIVKLWIQCLEHVGENKIFIQNTDQEGTGRPKQYRRIKWQR